MSKSQSWEVLYRKDSTTSINCIHFEQRGDVVGFFFFKMCKCCVIVLWVQVRLSCCKVSDFEHLSLEYQHRFVPCIMSCIVFRSGLDIDLTYLLYWMCVRCGYRWLCHVSVFVLCQAKNRIYDWWALVRAWCIGTISWIRWKRYLHRSILCFFYSKILCR